MQPFNSFSKNHARLLLIVTALGALIAVQSCVVQQRTDGPDKIGLGEDADGDNADGASNTDADPMVSVDTLFPDPPGYPESLIDSDDYPIPPYAKYLQGVKICLDPGHGGLAHRRGYKRGPTGVREAEMNLRVAKCLRSLLETAGAEVLLTREEDVDLSLADRADTADDWGADIFISVHHNAASAPTANFSTVWYHNDVEYRPSSLDLARYLADGLLDVLQLPQLTGVALKSDQLMYKEGFGVLKNADTTAALCECSFFTHPEEEQRLREPEYNFREAYGLFLALARYANAGLPRAVLVEPGDGVVTGSNDGELVLDLDDGLRKRGSWGHDRTMILQDSIAVRIDGQLTPHFFEDAGDRYRLLVELPADLASGEHDLNVQFQNMYKNSVINPHHTFVVR